MSTSYQSNLDVVPDTLGSGVASIAVIGPDAKLRAAVCAAFVGCYDGAVQEFSSYPTGQDEVPRLLGQNHDVVLIELDSRPEEALELIKGICAKGTATVMVYSNTSDAEASESEILGRCMRLGAREFLSHPFTGAGMAEALVRAAARGSSGRSGRRSSGRQLMFLGAKGGCGATTLACNYALALVRESPGKTLLIDLDIPLGDAALNLGLTAEYSTVNALQHAKRLDAQFLKQMLVRHSSGLFVLAAPGKLPSIQVLPEAVNHLLTVARQEFENVVVDIGARFDLADMALLGNATTVYLVTQPGIPELRNANRLITQCFEGRLNNIDIVLNRAESRRVGVTDQQISKALTKSAKWKIPNDYNAVRRMQSNGVTLDQTESPIFTLLSEMARETCGQPPVSEKKKKGFKFLGMGKSDLGDDAGDGNSTSLTRLNLNAPEHEGEDATKSGNRMSAKEQKNGEQSPVGEKRVYKGDTYVKGEDGQWYLEEPETSTPAPAPVHEKVTLEWATPEPITYGTLLGDVQFNAQANVPGIFVYTPGKDYLLAAGTHTLWVSFIPREVDETSEAMPQTSVTLVVTKTTPTINWAQPASISHGMPLTSAQLCAVANVPGTYEYSCAMNEVLAEGEHELLAVFTPEDSINYTSAHASVRLQVTKPVPALFWDDPQPILYGEGLSEIQLCANSPVAGNYSYTPAQGTVLTAGAHTLTVTLTPHDGDKYAPAQHTVKLVVAKARPQLSWSQPNPLVYGEALGNAQLNVTTVVPGSFQYMPAAGEILVAGEHTLSCVFTPENSANYESARASVQIAVAKATPSIQWPAPEVIEYGTALSKAHLNATASVPGRMRYLPGEGAVLGSGTHSPQVQFMPNDTANYNMARAVVVLTVNQAKPTISWDVPAPITYGTPLSSAQLNATATVPGVYRYQPGEGEALAEGVHRLTVTFNPADATNYKQVSAEVALTVRKATPASIAWPSPEPIVYGTALSEKQLNASASVPGCFGYVPALGDILSAGQHKLTAAFKPTDPNLPSSQTDVMLKVLPAKPSIQWPQPHPLSYEMPLSERELNAVSSTPGSFVYKPALGEVLPSGAHRLTATFTPKDKVNYVSEQIEVTLQVKRIMPRIQWKAPAAISYGTPLGAAQLNATSPVAGTFSYAPSAGNVLAEGTQTLSVSFMPRDTVNYTTAQATVSLEVQGFSAMEHFPMESMETIPVTTVPVVPIPAPEPVVQPAILTAVEPPSAPQKFIPETRTYKGAVYEKGADGQWHLQK